MPRIGLPHCQANVAKFRCNNGSLFSGQVANGGLVPPDSEPRDPAKSTLTLKRRRRGSGFRAPARSLITKEKGFRYRLPRCLRWHAMIGLAGLTPSARYANTSEEKGKEFDRRADFPDNSPRNYPRRLVRSSFLYKINASIRASVLVITRST